MFSVDYPHVLTTRAAPSSICPRICGGSCDQAGHRERRRDRCEYQPHQGRAGRVDRLRILEAGSRTQPAHRATPLRRFQRQAAQDRHRPQSAHRRRSRYSPRQSRALQARQRITRYRRRQQGRINFTQRIRAASGESCSAGISAGGKTLNCAVLLVATKSIARNFS